MKWIEEISERCEKATPGMWYVYWDPEKEAYKGDRVNVHGIYSNANDECIVETDGGYYPPKHHDAEFIAHSRQDLPNLIKALRIAIEALECEAAGNGGYGYAEDALKQIERQVLPEDAAERVKQLRSE
jgi:hypothetical protein